MNWGGNKIISDQVDLVADTFGAVALLASGPRSDPMAFGKAYQSHLRIISYMHKIKCTEL